MKPGILIVDDEMAICISLKYSLNQDYEIFIAASIDEARKELSQKTIHLMLLDLYIGSDDGMEFLQIIKEQYPDIVVIVMTAHGNIRSSVEAMKKGAFTYESSRRHVRRRGQFGICAADASCGSRGDRRIHE